MCSRNNKNGREKHGDTRASAGDYFREVVPKMYRARHQKRRGSGRGRKRSQYNRTSAVRQDELRKARCKKDVGGAVGGDKGVDGSHRLNCQITASFPKLIARQCLFQFKMNSTFFWIVGYERGKGLLTHVGLEFDFSFFTHHDQIVPCEPKELLEGWRGRRWWPAQRRRREAAGRQVPTARRRATRLKNRRWRYYSENSVPAHR